MKKERLDKVLVDLGWFETKSKASASIMAGSVKINDEVITKAGYQIDATKKLVVEVKTMPYVSRGGLKLEKALKTFDVDVKNRVCFDAGASTGGFSDCLLQNGARKIYAVDVGYGQLAWKIRSDERVKVIERTNIKNCAFSEIYSESDEIADLLVMDVSFISIKKVLPNLKTLLNKDGHELVCLIKPQFEAGKELVEKGGVVRDKSVHVEVINSVIDFAKDLGYTALELTSSPIKGPSGNIEYLVHLSTSSEKKKDFEVEDIVKKSEEAII
ncbi:TlyA family RNA methyltransferase [bacterium]|nr:TlyA family RNA methyltransferase [bacterium]